MSDMAISSERLKAVRKARKVSRSRLAKMTGLTERQVARLEGASPARGGLGAETAARLAAALQIPVEALAGELPLIEDDLVPASQSTCKSGCCG